MGQGHGQYPARGEDALPHEAHRRHQAPEHRGHPPRSYLNCVEHDNPDGVWPVVERTSKPMVTKAEIPSGRMRVQEANAASR